MWISGYIIFLCGLYLAWSYNFLDHSAELLDLGKIDGNSAAGLVMWVAVQTLLFGAWVAAILLLRGRAFSDAWLPVSGLTALIYIIFALVYPATAIDVYIYAARSHLLTDYGLNPSTVAPERFWDIDPFVRYASPEWAPRVSPYGPLWNVIAAPATAFDGDSIRAAVLVFKGLAVAAVAAIGVLIHQIVRTQRPELALSAAIAWLWCPIVLWEGVANGHNDVILMLPVLAALWCWYRGYLGWVIPLIVVSALIKVVTLMVLPVAATAILATVGFNRRLVPIIWQSALLSLAAVWIAFTPFYDIPGAIDAVQSQRQVWVSSPALLLDRLSTSLGWGLDLRLWYADAGTILIIVLAAGGSIAAWKRPTLLPRIAFEQFFWFLLVITTNLRPWYGLWLIAIAAILPLGFIWLRSGAWVFGALLSYGFGGWIRQWLDLSLVERDAINLAITLGPVLAVTLWWVVDTLTSRHRDRETRISSPPVEPSSG